MSEKTFIIMERNAGEEAKPIASGTDKGNY